MTKWNPNKLIKDNEYFCVAPWVHQYVGPPGDVKPCCVYEHSSSLGNLKKDKSLLKIWNSEETKKLRLDFLNGRRREECNWCNDRTTPFKNSFNEIYYNNNSEIQKIVSATKPDGSLENHKLFYMDIRFNNLCNFRCRTCGPHFSTSIATEEKQIDPTFNVGLTYPGKNESHVFEEMLPHLPHLIEVYFAGGEPMMQREHYQVLEKLVEIGNTHITVKYNTNFSKLKLGKWDVIDYWKSFSRVIVNASLDANYLRAEYWRKGTIWSEIVDNRKRMLDECPNVQFILSPTLSWVNVFNILELHKEWTHLGLVDINEITLNELSTPAWFNLRNVPEWKKNKIVSALTDHVMWLEHKEASDLTIHKFKSAIYYVQSGNPIEFPSKGFYDVISKFDQMRKENFFLTFPEHRDMQEFLSTQGFNFNYGT